MQFHFKNEATTSSLILVRQDCIFEYNFLTQRDRLVFKFEDLSDGLKSQPHFFQMNDDQDQMVVASAEDGIYIDMKTRTEVDLDQKFEISSLKEIIYD